MRGNDQQQQTGMFSYVVLEDRIAADHPLRDEQKESDHRVVGFLVFLGARENQAVPRTKRKCDGERKTKPARHCVPWMRAANGLY